MDTIDLQTSGRDATEPTLTITLYVAGEGDEHRIRITPAGCESVEFVGLPGQLSRITAAAIVDALGGTVAVVTVPEQRSAACA